MNVSRARFTWDSLAALLGMGRPPLNQDSPQPLRVSPAWQATYLLLLASLAIAILSHLVAVGEKFVFNFAQVSLNQIWLSQQERGFEDVPQVEDDIPDFWVVSNWNYSTQSQMLVQEGCDSPGAYYVHKTNSIGAATLSQFAPVRPGIAYSLTLCTRGSGGQVLVRSQTDDGEPLRFNIPASEQWQRHQIALSFPAGTSHGNVWLAVYAADSQTWWDDVEMAEIEGSNLLANSRFDQDGATQPPLRSVKSERVAAAKHWLSALSEDSLLFIRLHAQSDYLNGDLDRLVDALAQTETAAERWMIPLTGWLIGEAARQLDGDRPGAASHTLALLAQFHPDFPLLNEQAAKVYLSTGAAHRAIIALEASQP
ncbi:MAG: hypothetical protein L0Z70_12705, partial [Chloroflexi bacterium]|nr:hypothetical protein [Chloroflexota bacterium]